jgi:hypothetical protein
MTQRRPLSDLLYGECGTHDQYLSYVQKSYVKRYRGSYVFSDRWINIAKEAYLYGIKNMVGIDIACRAICQKYRCSYKRLANFIRELGLWREKQWILPICQITIEPEYTAEGSIKEKWEVILDMPHPFNVTPMPRDMTEEDLMVIYALLESIGLELVIPIAFFFDRIGRVEQEPTEQTVKALDVLDIASYPVVYVEIPFTIKWAIHKFKRYYRAGSNIGLYNGSILEDTETVWRGWTWA